MDSSHHRSSSMPSMPFAHQKMVMSSTQARMDYLSLCWKEIRPDGARYLVCVMSALKISELPILDPLAWNT